MNIELPGNMILSGCTMSGKTHLMMKLLKETLLKQIDVLVILSKTISLSGDFEEFVENSNEKNGLLIYKFQDKFQQVIEDIVSQSRSLHNNFKKKDIPNTLIILDDCVGHKILRLNGYLDKLSSINRHFKISIVLLVQKFTGAPRLFRICSKYVFMFNCTNFSELERITEECMPKKLRKPLQNKITEIFNEEYNFILINCFATRIRDRLLLNGKESLYDMLTN